MTRLLMTILLLVTAVAGAMAQNSIDALVDKYSTLGSSTFTSVVERNPSTRKVQKVVKMLNLRVVSSETFTKAFNDEASSGSLVTNVVQNNVTMLLTVEQPKATRIYMVKYLKHGNDVQVTIVVKYK